MEAVEKRGIMGAFAGGVEATAVGITAAIFFGYLIAIAFKPKG
jgi:stage V sporulation protein AE